MTTRFHRQQSEDYYGFGKYKSAIDLPIEIGNGASVLEPGGDLPAQLLEISKMGIKTVIQLIPNNSTATYVKSFLDTCSANGFKALVGFEDAPVSTGASGSKTFETTHFATAIQSNVDHAALLAVQTIDEPLKIMFGVDVQTLYTQLRTTSGSATYLLKADGTFVDQYINHSGLLEQHQNNANKQFATGQCDIVGVQRLCFKRYEVANELVKYLRDDTVNIHAISDGKVQSQVNPFQYWVGIPALGATPNRFPEPWEIRDMLNVILNRSYGAGRPDRISWQQWSRRTGGPVMGEPEGAYLREWAARLAVPEVWTF